MRNSWEIVGQSHVCEIRIPEWEQKNNPEKNIIRDWKFPQDGKDNYRSKNHSKAHAGQTIKSYFWTKDIGQNLKAANEGKDKLPSKKLK